MHRSFLNLFSTPNPNVLKEGNMHRNPFLALCAIAFLFLAGCGDWSNYQPSCNTPDGCSQTGALPTDTDTTPPAPDDTDDGFSCEELTQLAVLACSGDIVSVDCVAQQFVCGDHTDDGSSEGGGDTNITIVITVEADGSVTAADDDPTTTDCADLVDNDFDGATDYPDDEDCSSASDTSEAGSGGDDGGDDGDDDTDDGDCTETAGGIEYCDGIDNDCDGSVDNGDFDGDGYISDDCTAYDGLDTSLLTGDCNDSGAYSGWIHSALVHPNQLELGDWIDEDCDGADDEDDGCEVLCDTDGDGYENYEQDADVAYECVDVFFNANYSADYNPLEAWTFDYDDGTTTSVAGNSAVSCENSTQSNPSSWDSIANIQAEMCTRTSVLSTADCLALF